MILKQKMNPRGSYVPTSGQYTCIFYITDRSKAILCGGSFVLCLGVFFCFFFKCVVGTLCMFLYF